MRKDLEDLLCARYPVLFGERQAETTTVGMPWGISCGDGWFILIDVLCAELQRRAEAIGKEVVAVQVKQKFGGLRFYLRGDVRDECLEGLTGMAEALSRRICEICGAPGSELEGGAAPDALCRARAQLSPAHAARAAQHQRCERAQALAREILNDRQSGRRARERAR